MSFDDFPATADPEADLPPWNPLIRASKNLAAFLTLALFGVTIVVTWQYYGALADRLLVEEGEIVEGEVVGMAEMETKMTVSYTFDAAGETLDGRDVLTKEQAAGLEPGSPVEVVYVPSMPMVHRLVLLLPRDAEPSEPWKDPATYIKGSGAILVLICLLIWALSSWEHLYLIARYSGATGGIAWNQITKIFFNGAFVLLLVALIFVTVSIVAAQLTGVYRNLWPIQVLAALAVAGAIVLLVKNTPFKKQSLASAAYPEEGSEEES